jgi:hypothetical protein
MTAEALPSLCHSDTLNFLGNGHSQSYIEAV